MHGLRLAQYAYHTCDMESAMRYAQSCMSTAATKVAIKSLCELDRATDAIALAQSAIIKSPDDGHCDYLLGMALYLADRDREAFARAFQNAHHKQQASGRLGLAFLAFADRDIETARQWLADPIDDDHELDHIRCLMQFQVLAGGDTRQAEAALYNADAALARGPSQLRHLWGQLCWVRHLRTKGDLASADRLLRRVAMQTPKGKLPRLERNIEVAKELIASGNRQTNTLNMPAEKTPEAIRRKPILHAMYLFLQSKNGVEKEELVEHVWQESYNPLIHDDRIYKTIGRLRKALGDDLKAPRILTQVGRQYFLQLSGDTHD